MAARRLAEALDDEVVSINCIMKEGTSAPLRSRKPFVFVAPTYAWRLPGWWIGGSAVRPFAAATTPTSS